MKKRKLAIRDRRVIVENGIYHVIQRAPGRELLFLEEGDYLKFLSILKKTAKDFNLCILCFSLLTNHLHILTQIKKKNLGKAMKNLFQNYAQYFNKKYQRKGHVFCGIYGASLCDTDEYLLVSSLYIHLNAYKARIVKSPFLYRWHSLDLYIKPMNKSFINNNLILDLIGSNRDNAYKTYKELIEGCLDLKYKSNLNNRKFLKLFYNEVIDNLGEKVKRKINSKSFFSLEEKIDEFAKKKRINAPKEKKALKYLIEQLLSQGFTFQDIAGKLNCHRSCIYRLMQGK
ncbi:MAG: transposase [Candidatus Omnitrophica bacterium]|nr:transposase [Candidatus Omnitrophota bacterium]MCF7894821.1 transposase [Candidatus Omnitrophota bacterium]